MNTPKHRLWSAAKAVGRLSLLLIVATTAPALGEWAGRERVEDGVRRVENPGRAMHPPVTVVLEELWRVGGDSEAEGEFFGVIADLAVDAGGSVYLLDRQLSEVKVFDAEGSWLRDLGREGEGPGEFRQPSGVFFMPDGRLAVLQRRPARLVFLDREGAPAGSLEFTGEDGGFRAVSQAACRGGELVLLGNNFKFDEGRVERSRLLFGVEEDGGQGIVYYEDRSVSQRGRRLIVETEIRDFPWTLGPGGRLFACPDLAYRIDVHGADGKVELSISREYEPHRRDDRELAAARRRLSAGFRPGRRRGGAPPEVQVSEIEPALRWLDIDEAGHLWVLTGRAAKTAEEGGPLAMEVFGPDGRWLQTVELIGEIDMEEDRIVRRGDRLYVLKQFRSALNAMFGRGEDEDQDAVEEEEGEPMSVVCHRLVWTPPASP